MSTVRVPGLALVAGLGLFVAVSGADGRERRRPSPAERR